MTDPSSGSTSPGARAPERILVELGLPEAVALVAAARARWQRADAASLGLVDLAALSTGLQKLEWALPLAWRSPR